MKNVIPNVIKLIVCYSFMLTPSCLNKNEIGDTSFDKKTISNRNTVNTVLTKSKEFNQPVLKVTPKDGNTTVTVWQQGDKGNWATAKYLVFEIYGLNDYSGIINIDFFRKFEKGSSEEIVLQSGELSLPADQTPWLTSKMGILPGLKTKVVFPLSYLDAQNLFVPRSPRQLKGTITGNRLDPNDIVRVEFRFGPFDDRYFKPQFEVASIMLMDKLPEPYPEIDTPFIDKLGQLNNEEWPGKIHSDDELVNKKFELEKLVSDASYPNDWSKYGGWEKKKFKATGFFRTQNDGNRWWFVDPDGYAFLSVGVDCIRLGSAGPVNGIEDLFEWLPGEEDLKYADALTTNGQVKNMDFYKSNLIRVYGEQWKEKWSAVTAGLIRELSINTVGNWSDITFAKQNNLAYVLNLHGFPSTKVLIYRDFPDVFSSEYQENSVEFARQLFDYKDDPYMVGYFLRNEPQWAFGYHNLAYEMFGTDQSSTTKDEFVRWISEKYHKDISEFNSAWSLKLLGFDDLKKVVFKDYPSEIANSDFYDFSTIMVKKYVDQPCDAVAKVDNNHLNLGMRYAWLSSDLLYKAGERFDVFSINGYGINPPFTEEIAKISGKPVMIGEFHHGAVDRALPATGIVGVISQEERALAYRNYIEQGFARPELIGMHYFQWIDQPFYGRFDGENYNIGIVTINNLPYPELTQAMKMTNGRIYDIGEGLTKPFKAEISKIPPIFY